MRALGLVSLVQLVLGVVGARRALDDGLVPDVPGAAKRTKSELAQRQFVDGTALSAPGFMLLLQAIATLLTLIGRRGSVVGARTLGVLGIGMSFGYPLERVWRESLVSRDRSLVPLTLGGFALALLMAILGFRARRRQAS